MLEGIKKFMGGQVSPMETGKKDMEGNLVMDMTPEEAKKKTEELTKSTQQVLEAALAAIKTGEVEAIHESGGMTKEPSLQDIQEEKNKKFEEIKRRSQESGGM